MSLDDRYAETLSRNVWADGFGVWHAAVPISGSAGKDAAAARKLIRTELDARGVSASYPLHVTREQITNHGTVKYREV